MSYQKNLCRRVTIRLDEKIAVWVTETAKMLGVTPSEWVRMLLHSSYVTATKFEKNVDSAIDKTASGIMSDVLDAVSSKYQQNGRTSTEKAVPDENFKAD